MNVAKRRVYRQNGFTLIELVAVLVVAGILAVMISVGMRTNATLVAESDILRAHLRFAQSMAVANNIYEWSVAINGQSYLLRRDGQPSPIPWPGEPSASHPFPVELNLVQGAGVLTFDSWGVPPADYTLVLSDGDRQEQIDILGVTGFIP